MTRRTPNNGSQYKAGKSLRKRAADVQPMNATFAGLFVSIAISAGLGVYAKLNGTTGSLRLKVYSDDDVFEDSLLAAEDWSEVLVDYAEELGFGDVLEERFAQARREAAGRASAGRRRAEADRDTTSAPSVNPGASEGP